MNIQSYIVFTVIIIYIFLIIYVLALGVRQRLNRLFLWPVLCQIIWSVGNLFIYNSSSVESCWFWYKFGAVGQCFYSFGILNFFVVMTRSDFFINKRLYKLLLFIPPVILFYCFMTGNVVVREFKVLGNCDIGIVMDRFSMWSSLYFLIHVAYLSGGILLLFFWRRKLKYISEKKQAMAIIIPYALSMIFGMTLGAVCTAVINSNLTLLVPAATFFGTGGSWYATVKYKFMVLTPSIAVDSIMDTMVDSVVLVDSDIKILSVNNETLRLLGYREDELLGRELAFLFEDNEMLGRENIINLLRKGPIKNFETKYRVKEGKTIPVVFSASEYRDKRNSLIGIVVIIRDITQQKNAEENLMHLAHHDFLTGLPNRLLFTDRLDQAIARADRDGRLIAVALLDLDRFKEVNDVFGHNIGDSLLVEISGRLKSTVRKVDTIARFGGDEFIFIMGGLKSVNDVEEIAEKMNSVLKDEFIIGPHELDITASIGISLYPFDGTNAETLVKNADLAMYHAKNSGKDNFKLFNNSLGIASSERHSLEKSLRKAIEQDRFVVHYQPIIEINTGEIVSMEALVRWQHPEQGLIPPSKFIPLAEETGLISQIGESVLRIACSQNSQWIKQGLCSVPVSVNLSPNQFRKSDLAAKILDILGETGLPPRYLQLEITETTAMSDAEKTSVILSTLYEHGIEFIIDDFGIGYSSLNYLRRFPIRTIKIDSFFIHEITRNPNDAAIITAIFAMAQAMNMRVIAEGVETTEQLEFLRSLEWKPAKSMKCYGAQGFYFSRPVPAETAEKMLLQAKRLTV